PWIPVRLRSSCRSFSSLEDQVDRLRGSRRNVLRAGSVIAEDAVDEPKRALLRRNQVGKHVVAGARSQVEALVELVSAGERAADEIPRQPEDAGALLGARFTCAA